MCTVNVPRAPLKEQSRLVTAGARVNVPRPLLSGGFHPVLSVDVVLDGGRILLPSC